MSVARVVSPRKGVFSLGASLFFRFALLSGLMIAVGLPREVAASDAYDDEETEDVPEGFRTEEEEESRRVEEGLSAGGLKAPEAMPEAGDTRNQIEKELDESEEKDSGRGLEFAYLNGELGYQYVTLSTGSSSSLIGADSAASGGAFVYGVGLGMRLLYFTLGARFRRASMSSFNLWSLGAEFAVRVPLGEWEPYGLLGGGYSDVSGLSYSSLGLNQEGDLKGVEGLDLRIAGGLDYYFSDSFSLGTQIGGELLFLKRPAHEGADICTAEVDCPYDERGSSLGLGLTTTLLVGLHF